MPLPEIYRVEYRRGWLPGPCWQIVHFQLGRVTEYSDEQVARDVCASYNLASLARQLGNGGLDVERLIQQAIGTQ